MPVIRAASGRNTTRVGLLFDFKQPLPAGRDSNYRYFTVVDEADEPESADSIAARKRLTDKMFKIMQLDQPAGPVPTSKDDALRFKNFMNGNKAARRESTEGNRSAYCQEESMVGSLLQGERKMGQEFTVREKQGRSVNPKAATLSKHYKLIPEDLRKPNNSPSGKRSRKSNKSVEVDRSCELEKLAAENWAAVPLRGAQESEVRLL